MHVIGDLDQSSSAGGPRGREERGIGGHEGSTREAFCCRGEQGDRAGAGRQLETVRTRRLWPGGLGGASISWVSQMRTLKPKKLSSCPFGPDLSPRTPALPSCVPLATP